MKPACLLAFAALLTGCAAPSLQGLIAPAAAPADGGSLPAPPDVAVETLDPTPPPPPPPTASTVAEFDTTTEEDRAAALTVTDEAAERLLGVTLASLGAPGDPGIWVKTPLVDSLTAGRVEYQGRSINVDLRPLAGAAGAGSQISLPAMRLLDAPLTGIIELRVYAK